MKYGDYPSPLNGVCYRTPLWAAPAQEPALRVRRARGEGKGQCRPCTALGLFFRSSHWLQKSRGTEGRLHLLRATCPQHRKAEGFAQGHTRASEKLSQPRGVSPVPSASARRAQHCLPRPCKNPGVSSRKPLATWQTPNSEHGSREFHVAQKEREQLELLSTKSQI